MSRIRVGEPRIDGWLDAALSVDGRAWLPASAVGDLLVAPLRESEGALDTFLTPPADPFRGGDAVRWSVHAASPGGMDLLRCDYVADGRPITLFEGINVVILRVGPVEGLARYDARLVATVVDAVVRTETRDRTWRFDLPPDLRALPLHLTNRGAPPFVAVGTRHDRADMLVVERHVFFVFYKKVGQRVTFARDDAWLSDAARAAVRAGGGG